MGVFDEIYFNCKECGERVYFQSKAAGGCGVHYWEEAPKSCLADIYMMSMTCAAVGIRCHRMHTTTCL